MLDLCCRFSAEGTPFSYDSCGKLRMLNRKLGNRWSQVADCKKNVSDLQW